MKSNLSTFFKSHCLSIAASLFFLIFFGNQANAQDGKTLFKQNCGVCHTNTQQKLVGPGLEGITSKRSEEWLVNWIKDSQAFVKSGDADAKAALDAGGGVVMPPFLQLSDGDIKAILGYISTPAEAAAPAASSGSGEVATKAPRTAPMSTTLKMCIGAAILIFIAIWLYIIRMKKQLRALGYGMDTLPLKDRVSKYIDQNGRFLVFIAILVILAVMKSCISNLM